MFKDCFDPELLEELNITQEELEAWLSTSEDDEDYKPTSEDRLYHYQLMYSDLF